MIGPGRPLAYYVHINKNAGNTVMDVLDREYGDRFADFLVPGRRAGDKAKTVDSDDAVVRAVVAEALAVEDTLDCLAINLPYGIHRHLSRPVHYFTLLREPVSRCLSQWYWFYRNRDGGSAWATVESYDRDLERILADDAILQFSNDQTRFITGTADIRLTDEHLDLAKQLIAEEYRFVGAVERFSDSYRELASRLAWKQEEFEHLNPGDYSDLAVRPDRAVELFAAANDVDRRLHEWLVQVHLPSVLGA